MYEKEEFYKSLTDKADEYYDGDQIINKRKKKQNTNNYYEYDEEYVQDSRSNRCIFYEILDLLLSEIIRRFSNNNKIIEALESLLPNSKNVYT